MKVWQEPPRGRGSAHVARTVAQYAPSPRQRKLFPFIVLQEPPRGRGSEQIYHSKRSQPRPRGRCLACNRAAEPPRGWASEQQQAHDLRDRQAGIEGALSRRRARQRTISQPAAGKAAKHTTAR